jgi:hypothetical protein
MNIIVSILEIVFPAKKKAAVRIQQNLTALNMMLQGNGREKIKQIEQDMAIIRRWPPKK